MKNVLVLILFMMTQPLWAKEGQILKCLGAEEKRFHLKKESGPLYDLNQRLIGELIQIPDVELKREKYLEVCSGNKFSESWKLLELSIKDGKDIFVHNNGTVGMEKGMREGMIDDYLEASKEILLNFIASIQMLSPTPTCLKEEIPELDKFFTEIKYLQDEIDIQRIFRGQEDRIVDRLRNYPLAFEKCRSRLRKKAKSVSTRSRK